MIKNFEEENLIDTKQNGLVQGNLGWMNLQQLLFSVTNTANGRWKFSKQVKQTNLTCTCNIIKELEQSSWYVDFIPDHCCIRRLVIQIQALWQLHSKQTSP